MAWVSLGAGFLALLLSIGGVLFSLVPFVGSVFAFSAPVVAIAGIITGGLSLSDAKRRGITTGGPKAGITVSAIALLPATLVAISCGLCNACSSFSPAQPKGLWSSPPPSPIFAPPSEPPTQTPIDAAPPPPGAPPPAFPPPPMNGAQGTATPPPTK